MLGDLLWFDAAQLGADSEEALAVAGGPGLAEDGLAVLLVDPQENLADTLVRVAEALGDAQGGL